MSAGADQESNQATKQAKRRTKTSYRPGKSGNPNGRPKKSRPGPEALLPPGADDELTAMRWVLDNPTDLTYQHWSRRQLWKSNPEKFQEQYHRLVLEEKRANRSAVTSGSTPPTSQATNSESPTGSAAPPDPGLENLKELLNPENGLVTKMLLPENFPQVAAFIRSLA